MQHFVTGKLLVGTTPELAGPIREQTKGELPVLWYCL